MNWELGNHEVLIFANAMGSLHACSDPGRELFSKPLLQRNDRRCTREFEYIY